MGSVRLAGTSSCLATSVISALRGWRVQSSMKVAPTSVPDPTRFGPLIQRSGSKKGRLPVMSVAKSLGREGSAYSKPVRAIVRYSSTTYGGTPAALRVRRYAKSKPLTSRHLLRPRGVRSMETERMTKARENSSTFASSPLASPLRLSSGSSPPRPRLRTSSDHAPSGFASSHSFRFVTGRLHATLSSRISLTGTMSVALGGSRAGLNGSGSPSYAVEAPSRAGRAAGTAAKWRNARL